MDRRAGSRRMNEIPIRPVQKAYEQIADQLRELILAGRVTPGARLPTEQELATQFRSSRATVRESLRMLAAEGLVRTAKGTGGGTYASHPTVQDISTFLNTNVGLLSRSDAVSLEEFLEARELFEVPAARLAAIRCRHGDAERLQAAIPESPGEMGTAEQFVANRDFHSAIVDICSNTLLTLAAQPIFIVLQTHLVRAALDEGFHATINDHHRGIAAAIGAGDGDRSAELMAEHLGWLRPVYERTWTAARL